MEFIMLYQPVTGWWHSLSIGYPIDCELSSDGWEQMKETEGPNWISKSSNQILLKFHQRQVWLCPCMYGDVWLAYNNQATYYLLVRFLYIIPMCNDIPHLTLAYFSYIHTECLYRFKFTISETSTFLNNDPLTMTRVPTGLKQRVLQVLSYKQQH